MADLSVSAYAKINLGLDITGRREDGYHLLKMVMQSVGLADELEFTRTQDNRITLLSNVNIGREEDNLIYRAADMLRREYGISDGVLIRLVKRIPVAAGLAGGSSDCAATLKAMNRLFGLGMSSEELAEHGLRLGADVPYCLVGGTALCEGIGEEITTLPPAPSVSVLLVKPPLGVSSQSAYNAYDRAENIPHPDIDGIVSAIREHDLQGMCACMGNVLEPSVSALHPSVAEIRAAMDELGAAGSMMSGSGPTVFGLFENEDTAKKAFDEFRASKYAAETFLTGFSA